MKSSTKPHKPEKPEVPLRARGGRRGPDKRRDWQEAFLQALIEIPDITRACTAAGVSTATAYRRRDDDEVFAEQWKDALRDGLEAARGELFKRGVTGWEEPIYQGGKLVGTIIKKSDTCLLFLLKTHLPETYGDKSKVEMSNSQRFMTPAEEMAAGESFMRNLRQTLRADMMAGIPNPSGVPS